MCLSRAFLHCPPCVRSILGAAASASSPLVRRERTAVDWRAFLSDVRAVFDNAIVYWGAAVPYRTVSHSALPLAISRPVSSVSRALLTRDALCVCVCVCVVVLPACMNACTYCICAFVCLCTGFVCLCTGLVVRVGGVRSGAHKPHAIHSQAMLMRGEVEIAILEYVYAPQPLVGTSLRFSLRVCTRVCVCACD